MLRTPKKIFNWLKKNQGDYRVEIENKSSAYALLALQGPKSALILESLLVSDSLAPLRKNHFIEVQFESHPLRLSRTGYTREDGFEIYCSPEVVTSLWEQLLEVGGPQGLLPCGLGARDTLRLEMGYPLYGHELNDTISPLEADLAWTVKFEKADFISKAALGRAQLQAGLFRNGWGFK